jgi:hypothetical protein
MVMLCVRVTPLLRRQLKLLAASRGRPVQALAAEALDALCRHHDMSACMRASTVRLSASACVPWLAELPRRMVVRRTGGSRVEGGWIREGRGRPHQRQLVAPAGGRGALRPRVPDPALRESGAAIALGSDWPVARFDPRIGLACTRLRRPPGERDRAPYDEQALDGLAALEGYTTGAAYVASDEDRLGRIRPGFRADLTVLAEDPVDCDADDLPALPVLLTVVDGEVVFRA